MKMVASARAGTGLLSTMGLSISIAATFSSTTVLAQVAGTKPWMEPEIVAAQSSAESDPTREAVANRRAKLLLSAMSLPQKMQQLAGSAPEIVPELPQCFGARHVSGIADLAIPTFRITNGPVGVGQNDCVARSLAEEVAAKRAAFTVAYTHPTSAHATALPSALSVAASFDPKTAAQFGGVIATEMNNLALHVFEAPGINLARLPILGRNFEYFGEDPFLAGTMAVAEIRAVQEKGLIAMAKHYVANEQETNRQSIQETVDRQVLRELYLIPFEMAVKDGNVAAIMCAYNYVNGVSSCENQELLNDVLRNDWGFKGYVQSDFFAQKSTVPTLKGGLDHEMPVPIVWSAAKLGAALDKGELSLADIDRALERRYTQAFKAGIFDRQLVQTPVDFIAGGRSARTIGTNGAVLLQNNGALPLRSNVQNIVVIGKASQPYAQQAVAGGALTGKPMGSGGGSSDVVPEYTVAPIDGIRNALKELGNSTAKVTLLLVDDANGSASIDGVPSSFSAVVSEAAAADAVVIMVGTISEEGADRATFVDATGKVLATSAAAGSGLDWYADRGDVIAVATASAATATSSSLGGSARVTLAKSSNTVAMIKAILGARSTTPRTMSRKSVVVLKDNAGIAMEQSFIGGNGPAILETWFPGQEDGNIVADLLFGRSNPSGKLPVTFPFVGKGFLDRITPSQFPGVAGTDGKTQTVTYSEKLHIGYRWYDANVSGKCATRKGRNPCVAFPFGHGLSYTTFTVNKPKLIADQATQIQYASATVTNTGSREGAEVVQVYVSVPPQSAAFGATQPPKRLVGFQKVRLAAGAAQEVRIVIDPAASNHPISVWSTRENKWVIPPGRYTVWLGRSSSPHDLMKAGTFTR